MRPCFVFSMYKGLSGYTTCLQKKVHRLKTEFPSATFVVVSDEETTKACVQFVDGDVIWRSYAMDKKTANTGMASFARFHAIFDPQYIDRTMIVLDVHDDIELQLKYIRSGLLRLIKAGRSVFFMYAKSDDSSCPYECSAHKTIHTHRDAGFSLWNPSSLRRDNVDKFCEFWVMIQQTYNAYGYGADEVLMDYFFQWIIPDISKEQVLVRNKLLACECHEQAPTRVISKERSVQPIARVKFIGRDDMYICSRMEFFDDNVRREESC